MAGMAKSAVKRAASFFLADQRDKLVRSQIEKERAASQAKTARLRALRLAKEEADKADKEALQKPEAKPRANAQAQRRKRVVNY